VATEIYDYLTERKRHAGTSHGYDLIFRNCEHLATYCKIGVAKSAQVDDVVNGLIGIVKELLTGETVNFPKPDFTDGYVSSNEIDRIRDKCDEFKASRPSAKVVVGHLEDFLRRSGVSKMDRQGILKGVEKRWLSAIGIYLLNSSGKRLLEVRISIDWKAGSDLSVLSPVIYSSVPGWDDVAASGLQMIGVRLKKRASKSGRRTRYWVAFTPDVRADPERHKRLSDQLRVGRNPPPAWKSTPSAISK
jgi:hypothetical protein